MYKTHVPHVEGEKQKTSVHLLQLFKWSSRNDLWGTKLLMNLNQHEGEQIMTEFSFLGELIL